MQRLFVALLCSAVLFSCGKLGRKFGRIHTPNTTEVRFHTPKSGINPFTVQLPGGIMIYAQNVGATNYKGGVYLVDETDPVIWVIPNGSYRFFGFGFEADPGVSSATIKCADGGIHNLTGIGETVNLTFSYSACANTELFQPSGAFTGAFNQPYPLKLMACDSNTEDFSSFNSASTCTPATSLSGTSSVIIDMPEYDNFDGDIYVAEQAGGIDGPCTNTSGYSGSPILASPPMNFPVGGPNSPFVYGFNLFTSDSSCSSNPHYVLGFSAGIAGANNMNTIAFYKDASGTQYDLSLPADPITKFFPGASGYNLLFFHEP